MPFDVYVPFVIFIVFMCIKRYFYNFICGIPYKNYSIYEQLVQVEMADTTVSESYHKATLTIDWKMISRVVNTRDRVMLLYSKAGMIVIPKRAFADPSQLAEAIAFIKSHISQDTPYVSV